MMGIENLSDLSEEARRSLYFSTPEEERAELREQYASELAAKLALAKVEFESEEN